MSLSPAQARSGDIVRRCVAGDDAARAEFIAAYDGTIRRAVSRRLRQTAAARANAAFIDDIVHDVYLRLFSNECRALATVQHAERIDAWLVTVSFNQTVTFLRKHAATANQDISEVSEAAAPLANSPAQHAVRSEAAERLASCISKLNDKDRLVLQLFYVYNLRYVDIARALNMNINTVASRLLRVKQRLRELLEEFAP